MFKKNDLFCILLSFFDFLIIAIGFFFISYIAFFKPLIRDDIKRVFGYFYFEDSRFISSFLMQTFDDFSELLDLHFLDFAPYYQVILYVFIWGLILFVAFYPFFIKRNIFVSEENEEKECFDIKKIFLPILLLHFFLILMSSIFLDVLTSENIVVYEYLMFVSFYIFFLCYIYEVFIKKEKLEKNKLVFYSIIAIIFGLSIEFLHLFLFLSFFWFCLYCFVKKRNLFDISSKTALIPLFIFIFCLWCYYFGNPKFLDTGFADREELSYSALYQSLFLVQERIIPFIVDGIYGIILKNKIFISTVFLLLIAYIPAFNVKFKFKNIILFQIIGAVTLFLLHILIGNFQGGEHAIIQYGKTTPTFFLLLACFDVLLIYGILKDFSFDSMKMKIIKILVIVFSIVLVHYNIDWNEYIGHYKYSIDWNKEQRRKEFLRQKYYIHYIKQNKVAILPLSLHNDYEVLHEQAERIKPSHVHSGHCYPMNYIMKNVLTSDMKKMKGYLFVSDKKAKKKYLETGGIFSKNQTLNFTALKKNYEDYKRKKRLK